MRESGVWFAVLVAVVALCVAPSPVRSQNDPTAYLRSGNVTVFGDLNVLGVVRANKLQSAGVVCNGSLNVTDTLTSNTIRASFFQSTVFMTNAISSPAGTITIIGDLQIVDRVNAPTIAGATPVSFIDIGLENEGGQQQRRLLPVSAKSLHIGGVRQWQQIAHDGFDDGDGTDLLGWSSLQLGSCSLDDPNKFLHGHCTSKPASKVFRNLPPHSKVKVTARFHFIDKWKGETAFLKLDGKMKWADSAHSTVLGKHTGTNVCGSSHPEVKFGTHVEASLTHDKPHLELTFGTNIPEHHKAAQKCEKSWGVDDVEVWVK